MADTFNLFAQQDQHDSYPEPPQGIFSANSMDLPISPETYATYSHSEQDIYGNIASVPGYVLSNQGSPGLLAVDDSPSGLSSTSAPSSTAGSPQSNPGTFLSAVPEWNGQPSVVQPSIVGADYMSEYPAFTGANVDDMAAYDFTNAKPFVGECQFLFFVVPLCFWPCFALFLSFHHAKLLAELVVPSFPNRAPTSPPRFPRSLP